MSRLLPESKKGALLKKHPWLNRWVEPGVLDDRLEVVEINHSVFRRVIKRSDRRTPAFLLLFGDRGQLLGKARGHRFFARRRDMTIAQAIRRACHGNSRYVTYMLYVDGSFYAGKNFSFYYTRNDLVENLLTKALHADREAATAELDRVLTSTQE